MARKVKHIENMSERTEQSLFKRIEGLFLRGENRGTAQGGELDPLTGETVIVGRLVVVRIVHKHCRGIQGR
jgi:hypothetical protein